MLIPWRSDATVERVPWATIGLIVANLLAFAWMRGATIGDDEIRARLAGTLAEQAHEQAAQSPHATRADGDVADEPPPPAPTAADQDRLLRALVAGMGAEARERITEQIRLERWAMPYGHGLTPLAWFSSAFAHLTITHLLGNMIFLWVFGIILESRLGWARFLALYFGLTGAIGLFQQAMIHDGSFSLGASSTITALMAMAWIAVPNGRVECLWISFYRPRQIELPVWGLCALFIGVDVFWAWVGDWRLSTPMLHATGALIGAAAGVSALCLHWLGRGEAPVADVAGAHTPLGSPLIIGPQAIAARRSRGLEEVRAHLAAGDHAGALRAHGEAQAEAGEWHLPEAERDRLIDALWEAGEHELAKPYLERATLDGGDEADHHRLRLAHLMLGEHPQAALALLEAVAIARLTPAERAWREARIRDARTTLSSSTRAALVGVPASGAATRSIPRRRSLFGDGAAMTRPAAEPAQPAPVGVSTGMFRPGTAVLRRRPTAADRAALAGATLPPDVPAAALPISTRTLRARDQAQPSQLPHLPEPSAHAPVIAGPQPLAAETDPWFVVDQHIADQQWDAARRRLETLLATPALADRARLRLARIAIMGDALPGKALKLLAVIDRERLMDMDRRQWDDLDAGARRQLAGSTARLGRR